MSTPSLPDCALCLDGYVPAGVRDILGPVMTPCPACAGTCDHCHGHAVYPTGWRCLGCFVEWLAHDHALAPVLCPGCHGVLALTPHQQQGVTP